MTRQESEAARLERNANSLKWKQKHATRVAQFNRAWVLNQKETLTKEQKAELKQLNKALGRV